MVSILSFFTKKRPKTTASETSDPRRPSSPTPAPATISSPRTSTSTRIARTKSAARTPVTAAFKDRRASVDGYGLSKRKGAAPTATPAVAAAPPRITIDLPFEFESEADAGVTGKRAARQTLPASHSLSLGLDAVGGTPIITPAERRVLDSQRYTPADLRKAWEWLGTEVKERGAETVGIMLPRRFEASKDKQRQLSVLFVLARRPELAPKFPTIANTYPAPKKDEAAEVWKSRLVQVAKDTENPVDIAEALKAMLRRLSANDRPIIDPSVYVRFVQQEHAASYPRNAYATMLIPHLSSEVVGLLDAVLEVCNAIAMHAETNAMGAGRLCHLIGWWLLGKIPDGTSGWNALYDEYKLAGQRAEHLFYARIRWQSTQQKMPRRLVQLILSYPFGESSASSEHLPLPPASTFARRVLHVALGTDAALPSGTDPVKVLGDAIIAKLDSQVEADDWKLLRTKDGQPVTVDDLLSPESLAFLDEVSSAKGIELTSPPTSPTDEERYHPFAGDGDRVVTSNFGHSRRRSASHGDIPRLEVTGGSSGAPSIEAATEGGSPRKSISSSLVRFGSSHQLSPKKAAPAWDDFEKSGFGDSLGARDISLALTKPIASSTSSAQLQAPKRVIVRRADPSTNLIVSGQEVIDVDDAFIHFVEDGQLDPVASTSWPRFALVQLGKPVRVGDDDVSWLLVTVKRREVRPRLSEDEPLPDIRAQLQRSVSPSNESSISRLSSTFGFRDLANTFRRSSLYGGGRSSHRKSFINMSSYSRSPSKGESLSPVKERSGPRGSGASDAPTEYTIGDVGEMVKIPSALELAAIAAGTPRSSTPVSPAATEAAKSIMASSPSEWVYLAEGGAHVVFSYNGSEPKLQGHALRLQKVAKKGAPDVQLRHAWSEKLLPMVMPAHLLPDTTPATLDEKWTRALVTPTEIFRQANRRAEGSLSQIVDYSRPAQLMDNLTAPVKGEKVLALEIKPKWGFLPSASNLTPHESILIKTRNCRFCLHEHYRGSLVEDGFCPLDLYSGEQARVRRALDGLWKAWRASNGEKNNLRVFVDGNKVLPKDAHLIPTSGEPIPAGTYALIEPLLTSSNALATLKKLQANLDPQDISSLAQDFTAAYPTEKLFNAERVPEPTISELTEFVMLYKRGEINWTLRQREIAYALSAIFKDCSIIVRAVLRPLSDGYAVEHERSVVKVIDTDLKPLASLGHWAELDDKLWRHWAETKGEGVVVVDNDKGLRIESKNVVDISDEPTTPVTPVTPITPVSLSPMSHVGDTLYAATVLGSGSPTASTAAQTLGVSTPRRSPSRDLQSGSTTPSPARGYPVPKSPVPSIPDIEDATSALARVVDKPTSPDHMPQADPLEVLAAERTDSDEAKPEERVEAAPAEGAETKDLPAAEAEDNAAPVLAAGAVAAAAAVTAAVVTANESPKTEVESLVAEAAVVAAPAEAAAPVETAAPVESAPEVAPEAVEKAAEPEAVPAAAETLAAEDKTAQTEPRVNKPKAIDLSAAKAADTPSLLSPVSVVDPESSSVEVPPEDAVDFDADPFAKAPVVLPRLESRTSLRTAAGASTPTGASFSVSPPALSIPTPTTPSASVPTPTAAIPTPTASVPAPTSSVPKSTVSAPKPTVSIPTTRVSSPTPPSGVSSGVATPVAGIPTPTGPDGPGTPATPASLSTTSLAKTSSRVRDKIMAIENKDREHKPVLPSASAVTSRGIGLGKPASTTSAAADKGKRPVKKGSFAAFVRKASATFDKSGTEKRKDGPPTPPAPAPATLAPAPPSPTATKTPKEKTAVKPFGSLRSKKKQAAAAGAAAIAATATVATATLVSEDKDKAKAADRPEEVAEAPAEATEAAAAPAETSAEAVVDLSDPVEPVAPAVVAETVATEAASAETPAAPAVEATPETPAPEVTPEALVTEEVQTPSVEAEPVVEAAPVEANVVPEATPNAPVVETPVEAPAAEAPVEAPAVEASIETATAEAPVTAPETIVEPVVPVTEAPTATEPAEIPAAEEAETVERAIEAPTEPEAETEVQAKTAHIAVPLAAGVAAAAVPITLAATATETDETKVEIPAPVEVAAAPEDPAVAEHEVTPAVEAAAEPVALETPATEADVEAASADAPVAEAAPEPVAETVEAAEAPVESTETTEVTPTAEAPAETAAAATESQALETIAEPAAEVAAVEAVADGPAAAPVAMEKSPRTIPAAIEITATAADESLPPTASTDSFTSALSPTALEAARGQVAIEEAIPEEVIPAIPESAVLPTHDIPPLSPGVAVTAAAAATGAVVGLGFDTLVSEPEDPTIEVAAAAVDATEAALVTPTLGVEPPTPLPDANTEPEYFTPTAASAEDTPKAGGFSAVTPEFAATSVFAPALDVSRNVAPPEEETLNDEGDTTLVGDDETETSSAFPSADLDARMKRSGAPSPSPHLSVATEAFQAELPEVVEKPEPKVVSRSGSPLPGPPENVEMYQNASLPPLPISAAVKEAAAKKTLAGIISSTPMATQLSTDSAHEVASQSSAEVDPTTFATAPDTPAFSDSERKQFEDAAETPTVDLPELAAFTARVTERQISIPEQFVDAPEEQPKAAADNYRSSVHTFGGTQSEAAWLNAIAGTGPKVYEKSRLSLDVAESSALAPIADAEAIAEKAEEAVEAAKSAISEAKD